MDMYPPPEPPDYHPSAEQLARRKARQRFYRLYMLLPLGLVALVATTIVVLLLIGVFSPGIIGTEAFISALADIILILWIMPMLVLLALFILGFVALTVNRRQQRNLLPEDSPRRQYGRVQLVLWRVQRFLDQASAKVDQTADAMVAPVIRNNGRIEEAEAWWDIATRPLRRDDDRDTDASATRR